MSTGPHGDGSWGPGVRAASEVVVWRVVVVVSAVVEVVELDDDVTVVGGGVVVVRRGRVVPVVRGGRPVTGGVAAEVGDGSVVDVVPVSIDVVDGVVPFVPERPPPQAVSTTSSAAAAQGPTARRRVPVRATRVGSSSGRGRTCFIVARAASIDRPFVQVPLTCGRRGSGSA